MSGARTSTGGGEPAAQPPAAPEAAKRAFDSTASNGAQAAQVQERLVIKNADVTIVVKDPRASVKAISDLATQSGGFVVSSGLSETDTPSGKIVPAAEEAGRVYGRFGSDFFSERFDPMSPRVIEMIETGDWAGAARKGRFLIVVLEAPDRAACEDLLQRAEKKAPADKVR